MVYGLPKTARCHLAGFLDSKILYICPNKLEADEVVENFKGLIGDDVEFIPPKPELLLSASAFSKELLFQRMTAINNIVKKQPKVVVATMESCLGLFPNQKDFKSLCFDIKKGDDISPFDIVAKLVKCGYARTDLLEGQGQFSLRGDILDIYLIDDIAVRIDFFGDTVERIKEIDTETMKSSGDLEDISIYPIYDMIIKDESREELLKNVKKSFPKVSNESDEQKWARRLEEYQNEIATTTVSPLGEFLPLIDGAATIFDYIANDTT
ncbi:MAG: hypothetical protein RR458_06880, partial [Clostridia bacterium]